MSRRDDVAATCHIFCVSRTVLPEGKPFLHCHACGRPLAEHEKRTSRLVPAGMVYIIDEQRVSAPQSEPEPADVTPRSDFGI